MTIQHANKVIPLYSTAHAVYFAAKIFILSIQVKCFFKKTIQNMLNFECTQLYRLR